MTVRLEQVATLIERWRDARGMSKAKVASDAAALLKGMTPGQQRGLALEVVNRVAPQFAEQVASESGALTGAQTKALLNMLTQASPEDLTGLVTSLRSGQVGPALAMASQAAEVIAPDMHAQAVEALDGIDGTIDGQVAAPTATAVRQERDAARKDRRAQMRAEAQAVADERRDRWKNTSPSMPPVETAEVPSMTFDFSPTPAVVTLPSATQAAVKPVAPLPDVVAAPTLSERLSAVHGREVSRQRREPSGWDDIPDGWRRRRAVLEAIREGDQPRAVILDGIGSMARESDRLWVCKTLVAGYGIDPKVLAAFVDDRSRGALERLAAGHVPA